MKTQIVTLLAGCLLFESTGFGQQTWEEPKAKLTIQVKDENNTPVDAATVRMAFTVKNTHQQDMMIGKTDVSGFFAGEGYSDGLLDADVRKDGYYISSAGIPGFCDATNGQWIPWNQTVTTILRPIGKPVALYARKVQMELPAVDEPCGFDLEASDWVAPYGKGMKKDFIFTIHEKWNGNYDFNLRGELTFKNPLDGLQEVPIPDIAKNSVFKWERLAPENGFNTNKELWNAWFPDGRKTIRSFKDNDDELDTPTIATMLPMKIRRRAGFSVMNATQGSEVHLHQTKPPNALPTSERCPGSPSA